MRILVLMTFLILPRFLFAIEVNQVLAPSFRAGISNATIQNASGDDSRRKAYEFEYRQPIFANFFTSLSLQFAPEAKKRSQRLDIRQDMTNTSVLVGVSYPLLFRLNLAVGPTYIRSTTTYEFDGNEKSFVSTGDGFNYKAFVDYAVTEDFEVSFSFQVMDRTQDKKIDRYYGISFGYNLPVGYKTEAALF